MEITQPDKEWTSNKSPIITISSSCINSYRNSILSLLKTVLLCIHDFSKYVLYLLTPQRDHELHVWTTGLFKQISVNWQVSLNPLDKVGFFPSEITSSFFTQFKKKKWKKSYQGINCLTIFLAVQSLSLIAHTHKHITFLNKDWQKQLITFSVSTHQPRGI